MTSIFKHFLLLLITVVGSVVAQSQTIVLTCQQPGSIQAAIGADTTATSISVKGYVNAADMLTLRNLPNLKYLDLKDAIVDALQSDKDLWFGKKNFDANELPLYIFALTKLETIELPTTLTTISEGAFSNCKNLKNVKLGESTTSIGDYAFYDCDAIEEIILPASVVKIGKGVFNGCSNLRKANLTAAKISTIPQEAFKATSSLSEITFPIALTTISNEAFYGSGLQQLILPVNIDSVGDYAFSDMRNLVSAESGDIKNSCGLYFNNPLLSYIKGITKVGSYGLALCPRLNLEVSNGSPSTSFDTENSNRDFMTNIRQLGDYALAGNNTRSLIFGSALEYVGSNVFHQMSGLQSINVFKLGDKIPATSIDNPFGGITPDNIRLYVNTDNLTLWKNHEEWSKFNIIATQVGVNNVNVDTSDIEAYLDSNAKLHLKSPKALTSIIIADAQGKLLTILTPKTENCEIDISEINEKILIVKASTGDNTKIFKFIK